MLNPPAIMPHNAHVQIANASDTLEMLSGGFYNAAVHRVFQPPADQRGHTRLGLYYFGYPDDDVRLVPFAESPVLQRVGIVRKIDDAHALTMREWRRGRSMTYGFKETRKTDRGGVEEHVVNGIAFQLYD